MTTKPVPLASVIAFAERLLASPAGGDLYAHDGVFVPRQALRALLAELQAAQQEAITARLYWPGADANPDDELGWPEGMP